MNKTSPTPKKFGRRYPWAKWFRQGRFTLTLGIDFAGRIDTMAQHVRNVAGLARYRHRVSVTISEDGTRLTVQVIGKLPPLSPRKGARG